MREGKFDFDHHFAFLTNLLKRQNFLLSAILFSSSKESISKKKLSKTDLPFRFCKIGLRNTLFIFGRKNGRLLFCLLVVRFWLTSDPADPGLHETNFNTQCYNDAIGLTSRWKVRFRQTFFSKGSPKGSQILLVILGGVIVSQTSGKL